MSVSYGQGLVAVAAAYDGPIGVDLEEIRARDVTALADRWFAPRELEWMSRQPDQLRAFLHLWTAKEAVGKALGRGLRESGLRRDMPLGGGAVESAPGLVVTHLPWPGAVLTVAAPAGHSVLTVAAPAGHTVRTVAASASHSMLTTVDQPVPLRVTRS